MVELSSRVVPRTELYSWEIFADFKGLVESGWTSSVKAASFFSGGPERLKTDFFI